MWHLIASGIQHLIVSLILWYNKKCCSSTVRGAGNNGDDDNYGDYDVDSGDIVYVIKFLVNWHKFKNNTDMFLCGLYHKGF